MKKVLTVMLCGMLSGCLYQDVDHTDIRAAVKFCEGSENILEITAYSTGIINISCLNGDYVSTGDTRIAEILKG